MASFIYLAEYSQSAPYNCKAASALSRKIFLNSVTSFPLSKRSFSYMEKFSVLRPKLVLTKSFGRKIGYQAALSLVLMLLGRF